MKNCEEILIETKQVFIIRNNINAIFDSRSYVNATTTSGDETVVLKIYVQLKCDRKIQQPKKINVEVLTDSIIESEQKKNTTL